MTIFQKRLEQTMNELGMTQAELSRKSGVSESTISSYRSGAYTPRNKKLYALATAMDVSPSWLMGYDLEVNEDALDLALQSLWSQMNEDQKKQALDYIRYITKDQIVHI